MNCRQEGTRSTFRNVIAVGLIAFAATAAQSADYRWLNSWDRNNPAVSILIEPYLKAVEAASKGSMKFVASGPETVPAFEQLQPVASGAFQFLFTHGAYHFGTNPLLVSVEALTGTPEQRKASGVFEAVDMQYQKIGLKLVTIAITQDGGYQIVLKKPLTAAGDLQGHKIRGNPTYASVIKMLGASMVTLPPSEIFTSLDKGVIDGFAWPSYGVKEMRFHEAAKYILRPAFGYGTYPVLANLAVWNKLPAADKKIMQDEGVKMSERWLKESAALIESDEKALIASGLTVVQMTPAHRAQLKRAWSDGIWELTAQKHKKEVEEIRAIAKAKGID
ncbi:MAG: TRAP transporter substrate-binding protein [Burkholderiales bacterium]